MTSTTIEPVDRGTESPEVRDAIAPARASIAALGFLPAVLGGFLIGLGALSTWITVGIPNESAHTVFRGTDLAEGRLVLICAVLVFGAATLGRIRGPSGSLVAIVAMASVAAAAVAASFLFHGADRGPVVAAVGIPQELWDSLGVFRNVSVGPFLALLGGLVGASTAAFSFVQIRRSASTSIEID